jgi:hypothetical protein
MKKYRIATILGLVFFLLVCSKTKNPVDNPVEDPTSFLFESFQSECGDGSKVGIGGGTEDDNVIFNAHGDTIEVIHQDAFYQCCALIKIDVVENENGFDIFESDTGEQCNCLCYFDITTLISGLADGIYFIRLFDINGDPVDSTLISIPPKYSEFESSKAKCKGGLYMPGVDTSPVVLEDSILVWFNADTVWVLHKNAWELCCLTIQTEVKQTAEGFDIYEYDPFSGGCRCMCLYDVLTTIYGVPPGVYIIRVFNVRGYFVDQVEVEIPPAT